MINNKFSTIDEDVLNRWRIAAELEGIPKEAYKPNIKILSNGSSSYTFGILQNEHRYKRPFIDDKNSENCNMCHAVELAIEQPKMNLFPDVELLDFVIVPNKFPIIEGTSIAITQTERPMYTTNDVGGILSELQTFLDFSDRTGFEIFHNSPGFGATIPNHEHWHLTTFRRGYDFVGDKYGFDAAEKAYSKRSANVRVMPNFPFAHLIFDREDPERIVDFLQRINDESGNEYQNKGVPHIISQGYDGILVAIGKQHKKRCRGSADVAGHFVVKSEEEFANIDYKTCIEELEKLLFRKEDINLENLI